MTSIELFNGISHNTKKKHSLYSWNPVLLLINKNEPIEGRKTRKHGVVKFPISLNESFMIMVAAKLQPNTAYVRVEME